MKENNECFKHHQLIYYITNLFGTSTFNDENCIHTFQQVKFMPPLVHKDRVQKTVLYLKLKLCFCDGVLLARHCVHKLNKKREVRLQFKPNFVKIKVFQAIIIISI